METFHSPLNMAPVSRSPSLVPLLLALSLLCSATRADDPLLTISFQGIFNLASCSAALINQIPALIRASKGSGLQPQPPDFHWMAGDHLWTQVLLPRACPPPNIICTVFVFHPQPKGHSVRLLQFCIPASNARRRRPAAIRHPLVRNGV